jgi:hypothetical protein
MDNSVNPRQRNFVVGLIIIGLMIIGFFGLRTIHAFRQFQGHRPPPPFATEHVETDVSLIRDWMTIPYISRMYHVPPPVLFEALKIPEQGNKEKNLKQLNEEYYPQDHGVVLEKIKAAISADQPQQIQGNPDTTIVSATPTIPARP